MSAQLQEIAETMMNTPSGTIGLISAAQIKQAKLQAQLQQRRTLEVPAGGRIKLLFSNDTDSKDEVGHNWVLVKPGPQSR